MNKKLLKPAILSISMLTIMAGTAISPALGKISENFSSAGPTLIRMITTVPSIIIILFSLLCAKFTTKFKKRTIVLCGVLFYIIGGVSAAAATNIGFLLGTRVFLGIGVGMIMPLSNALIVDFYDGIEREHMMGFMAAFANFGGVIGPILAGILTTLGWRYAFLIYLLGIPVFILDVIGLPEPPSKRYVQNKKTKLPDKRVFLISFCAAFFMIAFTTVAVNTSLLIVQEKIGSSSIAGFIVAIVTFCGMIEGICLVKILSIFKQFLVPLSLLVMSAGFILIFFAHSITIVLAAIIIIGIGSGSINPMIFLTISKVTSKESSTLSMSIASSSIYLGQFLMPFVLYFIGAVFGNTSTRFAFLVIGIGVLISGIAALLLVYFKKNSVEINM